MDNGVKIPTGLQKIFNLTRNLDEERQAQVLRSASIFVYGRISGCKSDYQAGYQAGYAKGVEDAKHIVMA